MKNKKGFTLIEIVVVMAIIAVLAVLVVGAITVARRTSDETRNRSAAKAIATALEARYSQNRTYPAIAEYRYMAEDVGESFTTVIGAGGALEGMGIAANDCGSAGSFYEGGGMVCTNCYDDNYEGPYDYIIKVGNFSCTDQTSASDQIKHK